MKVLVIVGLTALALSGCGGGSGGGGGGGKSSAANTAAVCADWTKVVQLDNSDAAGSIAFYTQMRDLYKKVEGEAPASIKSDLKVLVDDEQQLVNNGTDSSAQAAAAQTASDHVDTALAGPCGVK